MKFCPECGAKTDGSKFCPECGIKLDSFTDEKVTKEVKKTPKKKTEDGSLDDLMSLALDAENSKNQEKERKKILDTLSSFEYEEHSDGTISIIKLKRKTDINIILPESVISIEKEAFMDSEVMSVVLPEGILRIGDRAFKGCKNLIKVNIPSKVMILGEEAFADCELLEVEIPKNIHKKGKDILRNTMTEKLMIEAEKRKKAEEAERKRKLEEERIQAEKKKQLEEAERKRKLEEQRILAEKKKQAEEAERKRKLEEERIKAEKKRQAEEAEKKRKLEEQRILAEKKKQAEQEKLKNKALEKQQQLKQQNPYFEYRILDDYTITVIGFNDKRALKKGIVEIPNGVDAIGTNLRRFYKVSSTYKLFPFEGNKKIKGVIVPLSVKTVYDQAFYECKKLKKINLENVINIGAHAFDWCNHLKTINLQSALNLGEYSFRHTALKKVSLNNKIKVGTLAFPFKCIVDKR